jgi:hypothetical protein
MYASYSVLKRISGPSRDEVTGEWRSFTTRNFIICSYSSPNIIRQIKSRRMRWAGHVAFMGEERKVYRFWWEGLKERDSSEDPCVDGRTGSERILGRLTGRGV